MTFPIGKLIQKLKKPTVDIKQKTEIWKAEKQKRENQTAEFKLINEMWKVGNGKIKAKKIIIHNK
jgi:hypothetical protein